VISAKGAATVAPEEIGARHLAGRQALQRGWKTAGARRRKSQR
jgi:hypothetical protein